MKEWFVSELQESLVTSVHDVQMTLNYLDSRGDLDINHIRIFGEGSGGTIAILSASADPRIKAVDVLDPWGDWPEWLAKSPQVPDSERPNYLTPEFLAKVSPPDPIQWLPISGAHPLRLEQTLFTSETPDAVRRRLLEALPPGAISIQYKDPVEYPCEASTEGKILDWLRQKLSTSGQANLCDDTPKN
jgi:hypothetical protein